MIGRYAGRLLTKVAIRGMVALGVPATLTEELHIIDLREFLPTHGQYPSRPTDAINGLIIHHSATTAQTILSVAQYHVYVKGWNGIGYHYAVGFDGTIYLLNDPGRWTNHAKGWNYRTIGAVLMGNFELSVPTPEALESMRRLESYLADLYGIEFTKWHRETKSTLCPGKNAVIGLDTTMMLHQTPTR